MKQNWGRQRLLVSFLLIVIIGVLGFQFVLDTRHFPGTYHTVPFILMLLIGIIGYWGWRIHIQEWISFLWLIIYAFVIILLFTCGLIDLFVFKISGSFRIRLNQIKTFFLSPAPFVLLFLLTKIFSFPQGNGEPQSHSDT